MDVCIEVGEVLSETGVCVNLSRKVSEAASNSAIL